MIPLPIFNIANTEQISTAAFDPLFSKEECEEIILAYRGVDPIEAKIAGEIKDKRRETLIHPIVYDVDDPQSEELYLKIADRIARYNQFGFDFDISGIYGDLQLLEYNVGGHYDWHMDIGPGMAAHRKLSFIAQLSDPEDYEGGEVVFKASEKERELPKDQGQMAVFPSFIMHKVNEITEGTRYALVTWALSHRRFR